MQIFIGQTELKGDFSRYARQFQALEIETDRGRLPKAARLRAWKAAAPAGFIFSVVVPASVASLEGGEQSRAELQEALAAAELIDAAWLIVRTPALVRPSTRSRDRLSSLIEELRPSNRKLAWEPAGLWEAPRARALADELGVTPVCDLTREEAPRGSTIYTRIRRTGTKAIGTGLVTRLVERLGSAEVAIVIVEGDGAARAQRLLKEELQFLDGDEAELQAGPE